MVVGATVPGLVQQACGPAPMRWSAIQALGRRVCTESLRALEELAAARDWHVRRAAIEAIGSHLHGSAAKALIVEALSDPTPEIARTACAAVATLEIGSAHDVVVRLVASSDPGTRSAAIRTLDAIWHPSDLPLVWNVHLHDASPEVRKDAAWPIVAHVTADSWRGVFTQWLGDPLPRHRVWACRLASKFRAADAIPQLRCLLDDVDGHVRDAAGCSITAIGSSA